MSRIGFVAFLLYSGGKMYEKENRINGHGCRNGNGTGSMWKLCNR